jgi:diguanylate cyclase (GGDEF)-like protein/PAS domain S-box-containing protein
MGLQPDRLRKAAEAKLAGHEPVTSMRAAEELLHELQVHQIELEMQNENLRQAQLELEQSRDRYMDFYDFAPVGYLTLDDQGLITEINLTGASLLGAERSRLRQARLSAFVAVDFQDRWYRHFQAMLGRSESQACELAMVRNYGQRFFARLDCLLKRREGRNPELRVVLSDITERIKNEEEIRRLAFYDSLTQLPNRRLLNDRLDQAMAASRRSSHYGALMFVDLDNFKPLNDAHGHGMGDLLLIEVARRITRCLRETDTVARFGGDEFVVLLGELNKALPESRLQAARVAEKIRSALAEPYRLKAHPKDQAELTVEHHCSASIGVALFFNHANSAEEILTRADGAMYQAKDGGRNRVCFFEPDQKT